MSAHAFMGGSGDMGSRQKADETKATCSVTGESFKVTKTTPSYAHGGNAYKFCCAGCMDEFKKNPEKYSKAPIEEHKHSHE